MKRILSYTTAALLSALVLGACSDSLSSTHGVLSTSLTDAPFPFSNVKSADMFVVRIDAKLATASDADVADPTDPASNSDPAKGWVTIATPNQSYNLLDLQNGTTVNLGQVTLPTGSYRGFRLILDTQKSSITLQDNSQASIMWPSAGQTGVKINLDQPINVTANGTQMVLDFNLGSSFVLRGGTLANGLLFKPLIRATATDETGSISGSVTDANGAALSGATVELTKVSDPATVITSTSTDATGAFHFAFLSPDSYALTATYTATGGATLTGSIASVAVTSGADASGNVIQVK
ncbi:MAG TPA: DUF4382 domain-containing protein [Gemmatimonadaceae bacterium]|nr:DUF4382 domain-containing protein [Gemmatimonadaceae bacterium]